MRETRIAGRPFDLQGHRGARGLQPENTLASFAHALSLGVSTLELDAAVTRDGVVIVSHDRRLNPDITRDAAGSWLAEPGPTFFSLNFSEIQAYDVGRIRPQSVYARRFESQIPVDGQRIPRLSDVFDLANKARNQTVRYNVETKIDPLFPGDTAEPEVFTRLLIEEVRRAGVASRTTIQSFDWRTLRITHEIAPEIETIALTSEQPGENTIGADGSERSPWLAGLDVRDFSGSVPRLVRASGALVWSPNRLDLSAERVAVARDLGLRVIPWTINDPGEMERLVRMGVDGLITDRPDLLREVLAREGRVLPEATPVSVD